MDVLRRILELGRQARPALFALAIMALPAPGHAQDSPPDWPQTGPDVDVALVLAVDISYSMDHEEQALQRDGYIAALNSPEVIEAIRKGMVGKIAVTYVEWAGTHVRHIVADWTVIEDAKSAKAFTDILERAPISRGRRTSVSGAIDVSIERLREAKFRPIRRVIDISGDGPNNDGRPVLAARADALKRGVTINGLPIILKRSFRSSFDIEELDEYYADCVIGGPGAFMNVITEREQFRAAIRSKILREVAQSTTSDATSGPGVPGRTDCLIGERLWQRNWGN